MPVRQVFRGVLELDGTNLRWVVVRVPFDPCQAWKMRRGLRVKATIQSDGTKSTSTAPVAFRNSLFAMSSSGEVSGRYVLLVNKQVQTAAGIAVGSLVKVTIEPDLEERAAIIPVELEKLLKADRALKKWYNALNYSSRHDIALTINEPKSKEARVRRAEQLVERMLLTMDGERSLPPILLAAFQRQPEARVGWEAMTPTQRRRELMAIYYYQSVEARAKRLEKTMTEAIRVAEKHKPGKPRRSIGDKCDDEGNRDL